MAKRTIYEVPKFATDQTPFVSRDRGKLLSTLSHTLSVSVILPFSLSDTVSHPYTTVGKLKSF
jgi:hypothetical protein